MPHRLLPSTAAPLVAILAAALSGAAEPPGPRSVVESTVADVIEVLRNDELSKDQKRAAIEKIAYARFDFGIVSRLVLAKYWKRFDEAQRSEFERRFKVFLAQEYGARLDDYSDQEVKVLGERAEPRGDVTVRTRIVGGEFDAALVDYRLRRADDGAWYVIDVVIEGVSLVSNWRDQFREVLRGRDGPDRLLEELRVKNEGRAGGS